MKYVCIIISILTLFSCIKRQNDIVAINEYNNEPIDNSGENYKIMYVDSYEGLRVRSEPNLNGEVIALLKDRQEIKVMKTSLDKVVIDDIEAYWAFIQTDSIEGWVFTGYLIEKNDLIMYNYNDQGFIESIILPNGNIISKKNLFSNGYDYQIDSIKLYHNKNRKGSYREISNIFATLFRLDNEDDWLYLVTEDIQTYGFIRIEDLAEQSSYGYLRDKWQNDENPAINGNNNVQRYGPLLVIETKNKTIKIWDSFKKNWGTQIYVLRDILDDDNLLFSAHIYEGGRYFIYNISQEKEIVAFNFGKILFNETRTALVAYGSREYEPPTLELYSIDAHEYKKEIVIDTYTLFNISENASPYYELEWENNDRFIMTYRDIGVCTIYYENDEWKFNITVNS